MSLFLRSRTHLVLLSSMTLLAAASIAAGFWPAGPVAAAVIYLVSVGVLLFSRRGARAIVEQQERQAEADSLERIEECRRLRDRISYLRLADAGVEKAVQYFLLVSGEMIEACVRERRHLPRLEGELTDVLAACSSYLDAADASATRRRFAGSPGAQQADAGDAASSAEEAAAFIRRSADQLAELRESEFPRSDDRPELGTMREIDES